MIPKEVLRKIRRIEIRTNSLVNDVFCGQYQSVFKGRGMEFSEVREYLPGDDVRTIDWNVTARYGRPFVKKFVEERELTVMFVVDVSSSQDFGTKNRTKGELAAEICAVLAFSAIKNNDRVGLLIFTDQVELFVPPRKGSKHVLRVIRELLYYEPRGKGTNIRGALEYLRKAIHKRCVAFLVSDFLGGGYERALKVISKRHDVIGIWISDPRELTIPDAGLVELEDAETGEFFVLDTSSAEVRRSFALTQVAGRTEVDGIFRSAVLDRIDVATDKSYVEPLIRFFRMRARRFR
ncbi:MAG: DUF58 domain-containing protein [bacterium]